MTIIRERFREDVDLAITELKNGADLIEAHIQQQYKLTMPDVELKALVDQRPMVNWFRRFRGLRDIEAEIIIEPKSADSGQSSTALTDSKPESGA